MSNFLLSQEYILLDSLNNDFKVKEYTLKTKDIYSLDEEIKVYNIYLSKDAILLMTILPNFKEKHKIYINDNHYWDEKWEKVDFENIKNQLLSNGKINMLAHEWHFENNPNKKTFKYKLVKKINGQYYASRNTLTEYFSFQKFQYPLISSYGNLNTKESKVSIKEVRNAFMKHFPDEDFPMDFNDHRINTGLMLAKRNYLSKEFFLKGKKAYQFWTFDGWWSIDGYNEHKGIDRIVYIENEGIVGGSYDFYFSKIETEVKLWSNIINEKVMIAQELK